MADVHVVYQKQRCKLFLLLIDFEFTKNKKKLASIQSTGR